jgi:hypothetical protein
MIPLYHEIPVTVLTLAKRKERSYENNLRSIYSSRYDFKTAKYEYGNLANTDVRLMSLHDFYVDSKSDPIPSQDFHTTWGVNTRPELLKLIQNRVADLVEGMDISTRDVPATIEELTVSDDLRWYVIPNDVEATDVDCSKMTLTGKVTYEFTTALIPCIVPTCS